MKALCIVLFLKATYLVDHTESGFRKNGVKAGYFPNASLSVLLVFIFFPAQPLHQPTATAFCFGLRRISSSDSQQAVRKPERKKSHKIWHKNEMLFLIVFFAFTFPLQPFEAPILQFPFPPRRLAGIPAPFCSFNSCSSTKLLAFPPALDSGKPALAAVARTVSPPTEVPSCHAGHITLSSRPHRVQPHQLLLRHFVTGCLLKPK